MNCLSDRETLLNPEAADQIDMAAIFAQNGAKLSKSVFSNFLKFEISLNSSTRRKTDPNSIIFNYFKA